MEEMLMKEAVRLGEMVDTDWAEEHADEYEAFLEKLNQLYEAGEITGFQFNNIGLVAFYDFEPKDE